MEPEDPESCVGPGEGESDPHQPGSVETSPQGNPSSVVGGRDLGIAWPYAAAKVQQHGNFDGFQEASLRNLIELVGRCVDTESPVHRDRAMRQVASWYGIARVGSQIREKLLRAMAAGVQQRRFERRGDFLWRTDMETPPVRSLDDKGIARPIREVAPEEVGACVTAFLRLAFSMNRSDLITAVAHELGYSRTGGQVAIVIGDALDRLVEDATLIDLGGQMSLRRSVG